LKPSPWIPTVSVLAAAALLTPAARPDGGRIPVWQPTVITTPGHYFVTRDITGTGNVIRILAPDVLFDLNGHTISATGTSAPAVSVVPPAAGQGVIEVRNGRLRGGSAAVWAIGDAGSGRITLRLEDLDISTAGWYSVYVEGLQVVDVIHNNIHDCPSGGSTLWLTSGGVQSSFTGVLERNVISNVGGAGILAYDMHGGAIRENVVTAYGTGGSGSGIGVSGSSESLGGVKIQGNSVRNGGSGSSGVYIDPASHRNEVRDNVISGVHDSGIVVLSNGNRIAGNVIGATGAYGILVYGSDTLLEHNHLESGSGDGIYVGGANNLVDASFVEGHQGVGLRFVGSNHAYRGNMLRNNVSGAVSGSATDAGGNIP
jgi:hypothetical protein